MRFSCCAGHTYVILVILSKRNHFMRYRLLRPNNIFQPLVASHFLRSNYKKVRPCSPYTPPSLWPPVIEPAPEEQPPEGVSLSFAIPLTWPAN